MTKLKNIFNLKLYIEGLKKQKVIGIAASIIVVGLSALIPIIYMITSQDTRYENGQRLTYDVEIQEFAIPLLLILAFAPFFVSSIFSYLNRRNESDFYHSIPYKRECVFNSFMLASFTWVLAIIVSSVAICGILWGAAPYVSYDVSFLPLLVVASFAASVLLMCFMALAMALTGTAMSNLFIFGLLALFVRVACFLFSYTVGAVAPIWQAGDTLGMLIEPQFFFPLALFGGVIGSFETVEVYSNAALYIYTVIVSIGLYLIAAFMYRRRRSEMAGKSAPSPKLQHVYRIAFTTPFVLLVSSFAAQEILSTDSSFDIAEFIILGVVVLLVYYMYELITTRSPKSMLKATPYLGILILIAAAYVVGIGCVRNTVLAKAPEPDEIASVIFEPSEDNNSYERREYEVMKCENVSISDEKVISGVADALEFSIKSVRDGSWSTRRESVKTEEYDKDTGYTAFYQIRYEFTTVRIKLKNGQTLTRHIKMTSEDYSALMRDAMATSEYGDAYLEIPKLEQLFSMDGRYSSEVQLDKLEWEKLYECYYNEYAELSREDKIEAKNPEDFAHTVGFLGRESLKQFVFNMQITPKTPKTLQMYSDMVFKGEVWASSDYNAKLLTVAEAIDKVFGIYTEKGEELFDGGHKIHIGFTAQIYDSTGKSVGYISNTTGDSNSSYKRGAALIEALRSCAEKYTSESYIVELHIDYNGITESGNSEYVHTTALYFVNDEFMSSLKTYLQNKQEDYFVSTKEVA